MIVVQKYITSDNTDLLAGTDLANIPSLGVLQIFSASTQNDTALTITGPGQEPIVQNSPMALRANGVPSLQDDVPLTIGVEQGGHYVLNVNIVTAATAGFTIIFVPADEL